MLALPDVTLCCVDTANHALALRALRLSTKDIAFARALLLTTELPPGVAAVPGVDVVPIPPIASRDAYSDFVLQFCFSLVCRPLREIIFSPLQGLEDPAASRLD